MPNRCTLAELERARAFAREHYDGVYRTEFYADGWFRVELWSPSSGHVRYVNPTEGKAQEFSPFRAERR